MNKLNKIFLVIIMILLIALGIMTYLYFNMRKSAKNNLDMFLNEAEQLSKANEKLSKYQDLEAVENSTTSYIPEGVATADDINNSEVKASDLEFNRSPENVKIEVIKDTISRDSVEILITDNYENSYGWGVEFGVQQKINGQWKKLNSVSDDLGWIALAYQLDSNNQLRQKLDIKQYYGELENGVYRIVKPVYDNGYIDLFSDEFEV